MKKVELRESQAPYTLAVDYEIMAEESVILERGGRPVAALVPIAEYETFRAWQQSQERRRRRQEQKDAFERERAAFEQMRPELLRTHRGAVVAIYQGQVVEVGTDIAETLDSVYERYGYVPCYVQRVEETPRIYKLPHRKVVG
ncbi:MAG: type II toxin-antitoxin system Phd/YefM family antitoxin [Anaerolineae bacterium]